MIDETKWAALDLAKGLEPTPSAIARVGRQTSEEAARWAFGQWELRTRARAKFERADEMLFVREALEQATDERLAAYHASRFPTGVLVADLTAGIGSDLIALARRGPTLGFELDAERAEYARFNLAANGLTAEVRVEDSVDWLEAGEGRGYAFADPARRFEGRRVHSIDEYSPNPRGISQAFGRLRLGVMKLSPMLPDRTLIELGPRIEFLSLGGECREALVIGGEAKPGIVAVHVGSGETIEREPLPSATDELGSYFYDCDPASVRANALGALCQMFELSPVGDSNGYLTGGEIATSPWLRSYRILYYGKADSKATRRALRELDASTPEIKQRGAGLDLNQERKTYASDGSRSVSLAIWPSGRSLRHAVLERIAH
ncbi:SAM-dependent methyltransferase [Fimbriimonas ginsengisoli]|uniref:RNA cap guanine-n2 methyltransferase n=1 Tax=Fimbriimonas ginsengisoli Gsoil 348 TaxID=661478 RepID=A0A068NR18_FIMGI|nr:SAM-dependent methyltransferase [Fimbriimonas ginsengisoli]AIE85195.1 RNA cap guanine-n2 methyltransferase [Fimbriimonas ginsengisoli Gsoil 348]